MEVSLLDQVEKFLSRLTEKELAKVIRTIELLETFGNQLGMPHSKSFENGLIELRVRGSREIRIFYCFHTSKAVLLHAFIKKAQKTPQREITRARNAKASLR